MSDTRLREVFESVGTQDPSTEFRSATLALFEQAEASSATGTQPESTPRVEVGGYAQPIEPARHRGRGRRTVVWLVAGAAAAAAAIGFVALDDGDQSPSDVDVVDTVPDGNQPDRVMTIPMSLPGDGEVAATGVWVAGDGEVVRIDPETNEVSAVVETGGLPVSDTTTAGAVWYADRTGNAVGRIDPARQTVEALIDVGEYPDWVTSTEDSVWVSNEASGTVSRIDPVLDAVVATIEVGDSPSVVMEGAGSVWVINQDSGTVSRIDPSTNKVVASIDVGTGVVGLAATDEAVWVTRLQDDHVLRIDPTTNTIVATIAVDSPFGIEASGTDVWVVSNLNVGQDNASATLTRIDAATNAAGRPLAINDTRQVGPMWIGDDDIWLSGPTEVLRVPASLVPKSAA